MTDLGRFGHHPDPAIDFEVEVGDIEAEVYNASVGFQPLSPDELRRRVSAALTFRVGGVESCVIAKNALRAINAVLSPTEGERG